MGTLAAGVKRETRDQYVTAAGVGGMGGWVGRRKWLLKLRGKEIVLCGQRGTLL